MEIRAWALLGCFVALAGCGKGGNDAVAASGVTLSDLAGTWDVVASGTVRLPDTSLCAASGVGEAVITANGALSSEALVKSSCQSGTINDTDTGTVTVSQDGSGTITYSGGEVDVFQISRDLNTMIILPTDEDDWSHSVAIRR